MPLLWTRTLDAVLVQIRDENPESTWAEVAVGVTRETGIIVTADMARNRYGRIEETLRAAVPDEGDTVEQLRALLGEARAEVTSIRDGRADLREAIHRAITDAAAGMDIPPVMPPEPTEVTTPHGVMQGADWQLGKLVKGHYDTATAMARVSDWFAESARMFRQTGVQQGHLLLLGDLLENETIFPTQAHRIDSSLFTQIFDVAETLVNGIRLLLSVVPELSAEGIGGNHGYNQKNSHPETNFDCIAMNIARLMLQDEPRLTFPEPRVEGEAHWYMLHDVGEQRWFGLHGHEFKTQPNTKAARDKLNGYYATMGPFDVAMSGHYHASLYQDLGGFVHYAAGSPESGNSYAQQWLATGAQSGSQWTHLTDGTDIVSSHLIRLS